MGCQCTSSTNHPRAFGSPALSPSVRSSTLLHPTRHGYPYNIHDNGFPPAPPSMPSHPPATWRRMNNTHFAPAPSYSNAADRYHTMSMADPAGTYIPPAAMQGYPQQPLYPDHNSGFGSGAYDDAVFQFMHSVNGQNATNNAPSEPQSGNLAQNHVSFPDHANYGSHPTASYTADPEAPRHVAGTSFIPEWYVVLDRS